MRSTESAVKLNKTERITDTGVNGEKANHDRNATKNPTGNEKDIRRRPERVVWGKDQMVLPHAR